MLSKEPVRIRRDWDSVVIAECDFCSHSGWTIAHSDSGKKICASCCDIEFLSNWQDYAKSLATEVLSLREQLAELKKQEPIGKVIFGSYGSDGIREASVVCLHDQADWDNFQDGTLLYLEAKPAED
ncbi:hypothetical protein [Yersinia intermedia]|uniref:hypothetical protein n=1 Tax=Yersinia intermedia TaxID=631 RepID=UPI0005E33EC3|nr:hypothetical protein [Yersinia intermedia]CND69540.1 Uncharacterised protein [Yersinia intermedia]